MGIKYNPKIASMLGQGGSMFGLALMDSMKERDDIMVLSSDMSTPAGLDKFKNTYPEHFLNMGIAEQNMIGAATGLSDEGYKTVEVAQACFLSMRCFEQVRQYVGYMGSAHVLVGIGSGFSLAFMGNTHYALEDIALMCSVPGMKVLAPCDAFEAIKAFNAALNETAPVYIRLYGGTNTPVIYSDDFDYEIGKAIKLKDGDDIQIIATGSMVSEAIKVSDDLETMGISVSVIDMHTIKPLDTSVLNMNAKLIVSVEEHRVNGGLGTSIADYLSSFKSHPQLLKIGVESGFSEVGDYKYLLNINGLDSKSIVEKIKLTL
jgi:transketolase